MRRATTTTLEPVGRFTLLIIIAHVALVAGGWWWWQRMKEREHQAATLTWFSPADFATPKAPPVPASAIISSNTAPITLPSVPVPDMALTLPTSLPPPLPAFLRPLPPQSAPPAPVKTTGERKLEITLTRKSTTSTAPVALADIDKELTDAFREHWTLPADLDLSKGPFTVLLDVSVTRDGTLGRYSIRQFSDNSVVDMATLRAASMVKRITRALPAEFSGDSHEVQMQLRAELK